MKALPTLLLSAFLVTLSVAQDEWVSNRWYSTPLEKAFKTSSGQFVLTYCTDLCGFAVLDSTAVQYIDDYYPNHSGEARVEDMIELPDSSIVFLFKYAACEGNNFFLLFNRLIKYDKDWNMIPFEYNYWLSSRNYLDILSDGSFIAVSAYHEMDRILPNGEFVFKNQHLDGGHINDFIVSDGDTLVFATDGGLLITDQNGEKDTIYSDIILSGLLKTDEDNILGHFADSLLLLSPGFEILGVVELPDETISHLNVMGDTIAVLTNSEKIYLFDHLLLPIDDFPLDPVGDFRFIFPEADGFVLAGNEPYGGRTSAFFTKKYAYDGSAPDLSRDVGVTAISIGPASTGYNGDYYVTTVEEISIIVENFGDEPVNQLLLKSYFGYYDTNPWCELIDQNLVWNHQDIDLLPGSIHKIVLQNFKINSISSPGKLIEFCMWTDHPDGRLDSNNINDIACKDFLTSEDEVRPEMEFSLSPNPAPGYALLQYILPPDIQQASVLISDLPGRKIKEFVLDHSSGSYELEWLPPGNYFVSLIMNEVVVGTKQLVIF